MKNYYRIAILAVLAVFLGGIASTQADTISTRKTAQINAQYTAPWPATNDGSGSSEFLGKAGWCTAAYYLKSNTATANAFINTLHDTLQVTDSTGYKDPSGGDWDWEFSLPLLIRIAMGNDITGVRMTNAMSTTAKTNLMDMLWKAIRNRSRTADGGNSLSNVRAILGSENHNATWRTTFFLAAQFLKDAGAPYGAGNTRNNLADGNSLVEHYNAWRDYWLEYYRQMGREGLDMEVGSPTYQKYTVVASYNMMSFGAENTDQQAKNYLTLFWADAANDFCPGATIRGGAGCRMYQGQDVTSGVHDSLREITYLYDWHDIGGGAGFPGYLLPAICAFVPPACIQAVATNTTKAPYEYNSHRWGAGTDSTYQDTDLYHMAVPGQIRRDTQWTPQFVMGSMTYDTTQGYCLDTSENHFCGVIFNSSVTNRIIVQGIGTAKSGTADSYGVTSASSKQSLVAALGKDAANNVGTHIFVSNLLYNNMKTNGNWLLSSSSSQSYVAIRIATGGYTWVSDTDGRYLQLTDKWSPLVIQCGRGIDYATNFATFTNAVLTQTYFNYDAVNGVMTYTNLMGQQFKMWRQSDNLPQVAGSPRSQNPSYIYQSPYISASTYGGTTSKVTNSYPGLADYVIDFDY